MSDNEKEPLDAGAMRAVVDYEVQIGRLIAEKEQVEAKLEVAERSSEAWLANQQDLFRSDLSALSTVVMRLAQGQAKQFDNLYRLLGQLVVSNTSGQDAAADIGKALATSDEMSGAIDRIVSGKRLESIGRVPINIDQGMNFSVVNGSAEFDDTMDPRNRLSLVLRDDRTQGAHSLVFPLEKVSATALRGVTMEVKPIHVESLRIRLRDGDDFANRAEISVDLKTLRHHQTQTVHAEGRRFAVVRPMADGWISIEIETSIGMGDSPVQCELIAITDIERRSAKRTGTNERAFAVRSLAALQSQGLLPSAAGAEEVNKPNAAPVVTYRSRSPAQEAARAEKRQAFLESGSYHKLARLRNIHQGKRAFIIGNGPSIKEQDLTLLKDEVTFVTNWFVNHPEYKEIDPTYYAVSSHEMFGGWSHENPQPNPDWLEKMLAVAGNSHKFFSYAFRDLLVGKGIFTAEESDFLLFDRPKYQVDQKGDINLDLTQPMDDGYTGIVTFCLPLAHFMGITEIYLVGCDCDYQITSPDSDKAYFYDYSQHTTRTTSHEGLMRAWADDGPVFKTYEIVRDRFALDGIRIVNATRGGRLEVFPRQDYESVVGAKKAKS